jgi:hypothetical protein
VSDAVHIQPWDFHESHLHLRRAAVIERAGEQAHRGAVRDLAEKERAYKMALAKKITELRGNGTAQTVAGDMARGDDEVSLLRLERDLARGTVTSSKSALYRHGRSHEDVREFVVWSRQVAPEGQRFPVGGFQDVSARRVA